MHTALARLADAEVADGEERATKLFEWAFNYSIEWAKIIIAFGVSLVSSILLAYFKGGELDRHPEVAFYSFIGAVLLALAGLVHYWRMQNVRFEYVYALRFYGKLKVAVPYLRDNFPELYKALVR